MNKVALFLVGKKGLAVLSSLLDRNPNVISSVVVGKDPGVANDYYEEVSSLCSQYGITCCGRLSGNFTLTEFEGYVIAVGWRWMLPSGNRIIVIHDSLLPKYRGFAPLVNCLINGEQEIGATAIFADASYDKGEILAQRSRLIDYPIKIANAIDLMCDIYVELSDVLVDCILKGDLKGTKQVEENATYSLWRDHDDYWIDWHLDSERISRFVDAVGSPYAGARCMVNDAEGLVLSARLVRDVQVADRQSAVGKVMFFEGSFPVVVCGRGLIKITEMETPEGDPMLPLSKFRTRFWNKNK